MKDHWCVFYCLAVVFWFWFSYAWSQEILPPDEFQTYTLGEIIISTEKPSVRDISIASEITFEDIEATHSLTVTEALDYAPGVFVSTGRKNEPDIRIHGFNQQQTLILIDGIPYYETNLGKLDLSQMSTDMVGKIDVVKGGPSVIYGPNALAGVVNIITRKPGEKPFGMATVEAGDYSTYRFSASYGQKVGIVNYWLNYTRRESDGWRMSNDFSLQPGVITRRPGSTTNAILEDGSRRNNSDYANDNLWAKIGIEPDADSEYYLNGYYINAEKGIPPSTQRVTVMPSRPAFSEFARFETYDDWGVDLSGRRKVTQDLTLQAKLFYHRHIDDYVSFSDQNYMERIATSRFKDYFLGGAFYADLKPVEWDILHLAFHYRGDSHQEREDTYLPFAETFSYTGSLAFENEFMPRKDLSLVLGCSYDWFEVDRAEVNVTDPGGGDLIRQEERDVPGTKHGINPMVGLNWILDRNARIFASVAWKSRFPTLQQLFTRRSGNPDLDPEKSVNYTVGASRAFGSLFFVEAALFHHHISDFISREAPGLEGVFRNFAKINMLGGELFAEITPHPDLQLKIAYTYNNAWDNSPQRVTDAVVGVPEHELTTSIRYTLPTTRTRFDVQGLYLGKIFDQLPTPQRPEQKPVETGDFFTVNMRVSQPFLGHFQALAFLQNILDDNHEVEEGFPLPGRSFWLGISYKF
jgi:iron complex outermembrane receptor protein